MNAYYSLLTFYLHFFIWLDMCHFTLFFCLWFFLQNFLNSHKSNFNLCLGLHVKSKRKLGVKHNDSCLWSSWDCFMHSIMHQTQFNLPSIISITINWTSLTHVVTSAHDSGMNKSPSILHFKLNIYFISSSSKLLITKLSFTTRKT